MIAGQPLVFQMFNDARQALQSYLVVQTANDKRSVYYMSEHGSLESRDFDSFMVKSGNPRCLGQDQVSAQMMSDTKASSFIDVNGDCIPDLVIESVDRFNGRSYLEFYLHTDQGFCLVSNQALRKEYLMASFADLNNDGSNDLLLVTRDLQVEVFMNKVTTDSSNLCAVNKDLSSPFSGFDSSVADSVRDINLEPLPLHS